MNIQSVFDPAFSQYGKIVTGYDFTELLSVLKKTGEQPAEGTVYVPGDAALESLAVFRELSQRFYGGMPAQLGYCNGNNHLLNCLEYHRDSELNIAADDVILLVAPLQKLKGGKLDTAEVEAFSVLAGTAVQFYETTLHYAPCTAAGKSGFRVAVLLPHGTNTVKPEIEVQNEEDRLLWACNKWLVAHPDSDEAKQGAFVGLYGENIKI